MAKNPENTSFLNGPGEEEGYWGREHKGHDQGSRVMEFEEPPRWEVPLHVDQDEDDGALLPRG